MLKSERIINLEKQGYRLAGNHTAVKVCEWCKKSIGKDGRTCYKNTFYGIKSWRCVQFAPTLDMCNLRCEWCWRDVKNAEKSFNPATLDNPKEIVDNAIKEHTELLMGFKGNPDANMERFEEAMDPMHFAISLTGEPTMYPLLPELVKEIHSRGKSTFIVSNGTKPEMLQRLLDEAQPTQMYITLPAPNEEIFKQSCHPLEQNSWGKILESLDLLKKFNRSAVRLTMTKGVNFEQPEKYAELLLLAKPSFVEVKGYVYVGYSRKRLEKESMPSVDELVDFANKINETLGYELTDIREDSKVLLLWDKKTPKEIPFKELGINL